QLAVVYFCNLLDSLHTSTGSQVEIVETDRNYYTSRGFDITNFQIDGVGIPLTYGNMEGDIDTATYDRIEIVRGANGLMSGAGNPSATINLVRKRPSGNTKLSVAASLGSFSLKRLDGDFETTLTDRIDARIVVANEDADSHLNRYAQKKQVGYSVVTAELAANAVLTAGISYQASKADSPLWGALPMFFTDGSQTDYARGRQHRPTGPTGTPKKEPSSLNSGSNSAITGRRRPTPRTAKLTATPSCSTCTAIQTPPPTKAC
ncbi:MAG: TonB-dependent receptor plug domain-containing protein, partial [Gammaproteobacteria bacterium]|nr:TonB-dependent receptor plug domain-containing protein [Gammaproteobacteria bacterium]